ncbi:MAG: hypothetical protein JST00_43680 [Deltaproteobacteria bacterium]|nr:hypothetical protein [Deltaproteobacteria bacterium]
MSEETKSSKKKDKKKAAAKIGGKRLERRFVATSPYSSVLVKAVGALGAMTLGSGSYAYFYSSFAKEAAKFRESAKEAAKYGLASASEAIPPDLARLEHMPEYLIAAGAILTGVAIWLGTASEPPIRVGSPGIGMERGEVRRMPWSNVTQITFESGNLALVVVGKDEAGSSWNFKVSVKSHAEAVGWIVKEALDRIPKVVDIKDDVLETLPAANPHAGLKVELEPLQVVGKRDAVSGKIISYEPDARVCERCERVYFKRSVPKKCKCGASLLHLRTSLGQDEDESPEDTDDEDDDKDIREKNRRELEGSES